MPSFSVNISQNVTPAISVTMSGNTTYQQFKNSLGNFVYYVKRVFLFSNILEQIQGKFTYSIYDASGRQNVETIPSAIDPYQSQNSIYLELQGKEIVLNGQDYIRFRLLPLSNLAIKLFATRISNQDPMNKIEVNNFKELEESSSNPNFFESYKDFI